jgi:hypothetical protein
MGRCLPRTAENQGISRRGACNTEQEVGETRKKGTAAVHATWYPGSPKTQNEYAVTFPSKNEVSHLVSLQFDPLSYKQGEWYRQ